MILTVDNKINGKKWYIQTGRDNKIKLYTDPNGKHTYNGSKNANNRSNNMKSQNPNNLKMNNTQSKKITVIWVRHCESCANAARFFQLTKKVLKEPLCTEKGVKQAVDCGVNLCDTIKKLCIDKNKNKNKNSEKCKNPTKVVAVYASFLPRAFTTAKLLTYGMQQKMERENIQLKNESSEEIKRICNIVEVQHGFLNTARKFVNIFKSNTNNGTTTNTTTLGKSNCHLNYINKKLDKKGFNLSKDEACYNGISNKSIEIRGTKEKKIKSGMSCEDLTELLSDYLRFIKDYIINKIGKSEYLSEEKINIIVGHGLYIKRNVLMNEELNINNTDAFVVNYEVSANGENVKATIVEQVEKKSNHNKAYDYPEIGCSYTYRNNVKSNNCEKGSSNNKKTN